MCLHNIKNGGWKYTIYESLLTISNHILPAKLTIIMQNMIILMKVYYSVYNDYSET